MKLMITLAASLCLIAAPSIAQDTGTATQTAQQDREIECRLIAGVEQRKALIARSAGTPENKRYAIEFLDAAIAKSKAWMKREGLAPCDAA